MNWNSQQHLTKVFIIASSCKSIRLYMQKKWTTDVLFSLLVTAFFFFYSCFQATEKCKKKKKVKSNKKCKNEMKKLEQIKVSTFHSAIKDWCLDAERFWHPYLTPVLVHFLKNTYWGTDCAWLSSSTPWGRWQVREVFQDPVVYVFNWQSLGGGIFYGHEDEAAEGIRGFAVRVLLGVVREVRVGRGGRGVIVQVLDGADAPQHRVTEAVEQVLALVEPVEVSEFLVLHAALLQFDGGKSQVHLLCLLQGARDGAHLIELAQGWLATLTPELSGFLLGGITGPI